uniref:hypothetical protein n=1 Tax=Pantanalinema rosaneae TaxID=1620701 RepID=UPI003D701A4F
MASLPEPGRATRRPAALVRLQCPDVAHFGGEKALLMRSLVGQGAEPELPCCSSGFIKASQFVRPEVEWV